MTRRSASKLRSCVGQGASLGEKAVPAGQGRQVKNLTYLSLLHAVALLFETHGPLNSHCTSIHFPTGFRIHRSFGNETVREKVPLVATTGPLRDASQSTRDFVRCLGLAACGKTRFMHKMPLESSIGRRCQHSLRMLKKAAQQGRSERRGEVAYASVR